MLHSKLIRVVPFYRLNVSVHLHDLGFSFSSFPYTLHIVYRFVYFEGHIHKPYDKYGRYPEPEQVRFRAPYGALLSYGGRTGRRIDCIKKIAEYEALKYNPATWYPKVLNSRSKHRSYRFAGFQLLISAEYGILIKETVPPRRGGASIYHHRPDSSCIT